MLGTDSFRDSGTASQRFSDAELAMIKFRHVASCLVDDCVIAPYAYLKSIKGYRESVIQDFFNRIGQKRSLELPTKMRVIKHTKFSVLAFIIAYGHSQPTNKRVSAMDPKFGLLLLLATAAGCSHFPDYQTPYSVRNPVIHGKFDRGGSPPTTGTVTMLEDTAQRWVDSYRSVKSETDTTKKQKAIEHYVDSGMTYSALICEDYFSRLKYTFSHRDFAKKELALTAGLTSALMGLAEASTGSIAATGALFGFSGATFDAYNEAFLFSADLNILELLVRAKQAQQKLIIQKKLDATAAASTSDSIKTLDQAILELDNYTYTCTRGGIVSLLNETVTKKTDSVKDATAFKAASTASPVVLENLPIDASKAQVSGALAPAVPALKQ
ncbi:hypothetical protein [Pseudomonas umsongensis]|jgi:hypothetical protein|uniref:hypothetical protein n=1 Tax=Pseudomonas umsongensis TaxID=198618 RepID=UPI0015B8ADFF|nr:hypothetical protein [Pseudomonas umsongensis]